MCKPTSHPDKKAAAFGYGKDPLKKAATAPTKTLKETLNKLDMPGLKKVVR